MRRRIMSVGLVLATGLALLAVTGAAGSPASPDTIFVGGTILTIDARDRVAQAVAVAGDRIVAVGTTAEVRALAGPRTRIVDLRGRTMLPGFIDAHSHFPAAGFDGPYTVDLQGPPVGRIRTMDELVAALRAKARATPPGQWIIGRGYDQTLLAERRHPTRRDLDRVSTAHPIVLVHASGHLFAANGAALALAGVTRATPAPPGGVIQKDPATGEPTGVFEEANPVMPIVPPPTAAQQREATRRAVALYTAAGVTTSIIAGNGRAEVEALVEASRRGELPLRVTSMLRGTPEAVRAMRALIPPSDRLKAGAVKLGADGSIQGYTGYLREPYHVPPTAGDTGYRGYPSQPRDTLAARVAAFHRDGWQVAIHANGDAAIDDAIAAFRAAQQDHPRADPRFRVEHAQMAREDQLDAFAASGITPSFFVSHTYYWGDVHRDVFQGPVRAAHTSPLASARRRGIRFSLHLDSPVTPMRPLQAVWSAVTRLTRSGQVLGPDQRISPAQALRAVTIDAAWQNFEEGEKGSIEVGKLADLVILAEDPTRVAAEHIRDIRVLETIVGGRTVYAWDGAAGVSRPARRPAAPRAR